MSRKLSPEEQARKREVIKYWLELLRDGLRAVDPDLDLTLKPMFGGACYYVNGRVFAAWFGEGNIALKLVEPQRSAFVGLSGAQTTIAVSYIAVPDNLISDRDQFERWLTYAVDSALRG